MHVLTSMPVAKLYLYMARHGVLYKMCALASDQGWLRHWHTIIQKQCGTFILYINIVVTCTPVANKRFAKKVRNAT